jgi:hypothetical protein
MERSGLVTGGITGTTSATGAVASELRFTPQATEFVAKFFH